MLLEHRIATPGKAGGVAWTVANVDEAILYEDALMEYFGYLRQARLIHVNALDETSLWRQGGDDNGGDWYDEWVDEDGRRLCDVVRQKEWGDEERKYVVMHGPSSEMAAFVWKCPTMEYALALKTMLEDYDWSLREHGALLLETLQAETPSTRLVRRLSEFGSSYIDAARAVIAVERASVVTYRRQTDA